MARFEILSFIMCVSDKCSVLIPGTRNNWLCYAVPCRVRRRLVGPPFGGVKTEQNTYVTVLFALALHVQIGPSRPGLACVRRSALTDDSGNR